MSEDKSAKLQDLVKSFEEDYKKFKEKGTDAAGKRARATLKEIKEFAHQTRQSIQEERGS